MFLYVGVAYFYSTFGVCVSKSKRYIKYFCLKFCPPQANLILFMKSRLLENHHIHVGYINLYSVCGLDFNISVVNP